MLIIDVIDDIKVHAPEDASNHGIKKYSTYFIEENMYFGSVSERHPLDSTLTIATI